MFYCKKFNCWTIFSDVTDFEDNSLDDPDYEPGENEITEQNIEINVLKNLNIDELKTKDSFNVRGFGCDETNMYVAESRGKMRQ